MDAVIIVAVGLYFCLRKVKAVETTAFTPVSVQEVANLEIKLNDMFYEDEHAFEEVAHGLNFC